MKWEIICQARCLTQNKHPVNVRCHDLLFPSSPNSFLLPFSPCFLLTPEPTAVQCPCSTHSGYSFKDLQWSFHCQANKYFSLFFLLSLGYLTSSKTLFFLEFSSLLILLVNLNIFQLSLLASSSLQPLYVSIPKCNPSSIFPFHFLWLQLSFIISLLLNLYLYL